MVDYKNKHLPIALDNPSRTWAIHMGKDRVSAIQPKVRMIYIKCYLT